MLPEAAQLTNAVVSEACTFQTFIPDPQERVSESTATPRATATRVLTLTPTPAFMQAVFPFGSTGIGEGKFDDARYIAVDGNGNIIFAEYQDGHVQVFDALGKYRYQWKVGGEKTITLEGKLDFAIQSHQQYFLDRYERGL